MTAPGAERKPKATVTVVLTNPGCDILARAAQVGLDMGWVLYPQERVILKGLIRRLKLRRARAKPGRKP